MNQFQAFAVADVPEGQDLGSPQVAGVLLGFGRLETRNLHPRNDTSLMVQKSSQLILV